MVTVGEYTGLGERVFAGGGCEASLTARTRCLWVELGECGELLYGRRFPLRLKWGYLFVLRKASNTVWK